VREMADVLSQNEIDDLLVVDKVSIALSLRKQISPEIVIVFDEKNKVSEKINVSSVIEKFKNYECKFTDIVEIKNDKVVLKGSGERANVPGSKTYKGFSTVSKDTQSFALYDLALIKQDIINHFHIRQGERLENPAFGTIIWDTLFEPLTEELKNAIIENVSNIINYDPRVEVNSITVDNYESGIQIECSLVYLPYNISESMRLKFDESAGFIN
jgi:phage baseplate assembly protein W